MSSKVGIETNIKKVAAELKACEKKVKTAVKKSIDEAGKYGVRQEKALVTPHSKHPNGILSKITYQSIGDYNGVLNLLLPKHAKYLEKGRGPVYPKHAKALRFEIKGETIFAKSVGPAKAKPFVEPTRMALKVMLPRIVKKNVHTALK